MSTEPAIQGVETPMQDEFPLTLVLGDSISSRVINALIRTEGRSTLTLHDLYERVEATNEAEHTEVSETLDRLQQIEAIERPAYGRIRYRPTHHAFRHLATLDDLLVGELYPDSWYATVMTADESSTDS